MSGSKLVLDEARLHIHAAEAAPPVRAILARAGCPEDIAAEVTDHLIDASLRGVDSHGIMRVLQYADQFAAGYMSPAARPRLLADPGTPAQVDGGGGIGIPAMRLAITHLTAEARTRGMATIAVRHLGHTGRLGAYAEQGAEAGCLTIIVGGGGRQNWRQVAPYGGRKAVLPTNPWCLAAPGGARGPVVVDFATSMLAGGWLYAARSAGAQLPPGMLVDPEGRPTTDPEDYFRGGAILPRGGPMGYGLALMAEMMCDAMLGPATTEVNWLALALDTTRYRSPSALQQAAEEILAEVRACPPAAGHTAVEVPGERERALKARHLATGIPLPARTWRQILDRAGLHG